MKGFVIISAGDRQSLAYARKVLGHGGVNTFPDYAGVCGRCGADLSSNVPQLLCPACGEGNTLASKEEYGAWSAKIRGRGSCTFIDLAARNQI